MKLNNISHKALKTATQLVESLQPNTSKSARDALIRIFEPQYDDDKIAMEGTAFFPENSINGYLSKTLKLLPGYLDFYSGYYYSDEELIIICYAEGDYNLKIFDDELHYRMEKASTDRFYRDDENITEAMNSRETIETLLQKYCKDLTDTRYENSEFKGSFEYTEGVKYYKIVHVLSNGQRSAFAFVDREGNIYKAAGWNTPAKGIRGKLWSVDSGDTLYRRG